MQSNPLFPDRSDGVVQDKDVSRMSAKRLIFDNMKKSLPNGFTGQDMGRKDEEGAEGI
jgi:hypothetical protein